MEFKTACPLPWLHFSAHTSGAMRICCSTDNGGFVKDTNGDRVHIDQFESLSQYYNQTSLKDVRRQMLLEERPAICRKCYQLEDAGGMSLRQIYVRHYREQLERLVDATLADGEISPDVKYIDFSLGNHCNLKCRMCSPSASDFLQKEWEDLGLPYDRNWFEKAKSTWEWSPRFAGLVDELLESCEEILLTGGEPFVTESHYKILEAAIEKGKSSNILLRYHSNLGLLPDRVVQLWQHFKRIEVHVSLESVGELNEVIRFPSKWKVVDRNLRKLIDLKETLPMHLEVHTTFQAYTIFGLTRLFEYLKQFSEDIPQFPYLIWLDNPSYLSVLSLPLELRKKATTQLSSYIEAHRDAYTSGPHSGFVLEKISMLEAYLNRMESEPENGEFSKMVHFTKQLDESRGQNLLSLIPEIQAYL